MFNNFLDGIENDLKTFMVYWSSRAEVEDNLLYFSFGFVMICCINASMTFTD